MSARKLKGEWSLESTEHLGKIFCKFLGRNFGIQYQWISPVRWWQFWRWRKAFTDDYHLCRADETLLVKLLTDEVRNEIDQEKEAPVARL